MTAECAICRTFLPIQLDLSGDVIQDYLYVCNRCKPKKGVVILCTEDDHGLDISDDEAAKIFGGGLPSKRVAILDRKTRDRILVELLSEDDRRELHRLYESIIDINDQIASLQDEISDMKIEIDETTKKIQTIMTHRLEKRTVGR